MAWDPILKLLLKQTQGCNQILISMLNFKTMVFFILKLCAFTQLSHSFSPLAYAYNAYVIPLFCFSSCPLTCMHMDMLPIDGPNWSEIVWMVYTMAGPKLAVSINKGHWLIWPSDARMMIPSVTTSIEKLYFWNEFSTLLIDGSADHIHLYY